MNALPTPQQLTPDAKEALRKTIRRLRDSLLTQLADEVKGAYRWSIPLGKAKLPHAMAMRRQRLENWIAEQSRGEGKKGKKPSDQQLAELKERYLNQAVKEAAHTWLNRLVVLRILERAGLSKPLVLSGGWKSPGYGEFAEFARALCGDVKDDTQGYAALLRLVFDELAVELPGVFGNVGLSALFPVPAATLRELVEALNDERLDSAWADDTTLGWVYQFWNDPEREALDEKINGGGKIEPHEIAPKTQMFTERYMVEWLLQNSLGQTWLAMCKKQGWTPDFESVRGELEARRADWRKRREAGEVAADALMPIHSALEDQWKYWVPQALPEDAVSTAPSSLRELKLLDPACGSGHFLVIAFDLLSALYREEARHRGQSWSDAQIAQWIVACNLHGIDIDPRAIQIAAAAVWLKAKRFAPQARLGRMNLVAPNFKLPEDDPALLRLESELSREVGIPPKLTRQLVAALNGVDHLGTLLRVDKDINAALEVYDKETRGQPLQGNLFTGMPPQQLKLTLEEAKVSALDKLGLFLDAHEGESDLGLRLEGEQLAAGVRFVQMAREGRYDIVAANPPYQGTSRIAQADWLKQHYPRAKADLYACFLERCHELARKGGLAALVSMRGWMFLSQFTDLRTHLLTEHSLQCIGDLGTGAFASRSMDDVISTALCVFRSRGEKQTSVALKTMPLVDKERDAGKPARRRAALLANDERFDFDVAKLSGIEGTPLVYWWDDEFLDDYVRAPKLADVAPIAQGLITADNSRFLRRPWEVRPMPFSVYRNRKPVVALMSWVPYIKGAQGRQWIEPLTDVLSWTANGLAIKVLERDGRQASRTQNESLYFRLGVAFSPIGSSFSARKHRYHGIFDSMGSSTFPESIPTTNLVLNSSTSQFILQSLNPTIHFQVGDVARLAITSQASSAEIDASIDAAFDVHESGREPSVEFRRPGPSPWRYAQAWAQRAVDRPKDKALPPYEAEYDALDPISHLSFVIGVALGRFGKNGEGILDLRLESTEHIDPARAAFVGHNNGVASSAWGAVGIGSKLADVRTSLANVDGASDTPNIAPAPRPKDQKILPAGILFISAAPNVTDSFSQPAALCIEAAWDAHASAITSGKSTTLNDWLRKDFFAYHKGLYENRPIYFPLSSAAKSFVAFVSIHRWADNTLQTLLAAHLHPAREKLQGEINDLNSARLSADKAQKSKAEKQYAKSQKLLEELTDFLQAVTQCAEKGAPPTDSQCPAREVDAPFKMDLDDGVMINSAALWPLLLPQWKDPKKWWKELCTSSDAKDYDWAHLSARYFPKRVDDKCKIDPSLGVAHGCFWKYHPAKAYAWELRLQDEIDPKFTIDEPGSDEARAAFLEQQPALAREIEAKERTRRERNRRKNATEQDEPEPPSSDPSEPFQLEN